MNYNEKNKDELINELQQLQQKYTSVIASYEAEIAERRRVGEDLEKSRLLLQSIIEGTTDAIYVKDLNGMYLLFNHAAELFTGKKTGEVLGKDDTFLFPAEEAAAIINGDQQVMRDGKVATYEEFITTPDAKLSTFLSTKGPVLDTKGNPVGLFGIARDISDRNQAEEKLRTSEAKFRAVAELSPMAIYASSGSDQKATYVNEAFYKTFGFSTEDVPTVGDWWIKAFPDEKYRQQVIDQWIHNIEQAGKNNSDVEALECVCTCKDGSVKIIAWVGKTFGDEFWAFGYDLTERKQAEEELIKSKILLSDTERIGKVGGWEFNIDTLDMTWTDEVYSIHEVELNSDQNVEKGINFYTPESRPVIEKAVQRAIEVGEPFDVELEIITAKGNRRNVHAIGKADLDNRRVYGFFQDITERKQAEEEIRKLNETLEHKVTKRTAQLEESNKELEAFTYSVSHDLRAPLRHISGYVDLLNERFKDSLPVKGVHYLDTIADSSRQMGRLIDDLLQFSRTGRQEMHWGDIDMNILVKDVLGKMKQEISGRTIKWVIAPLPHVNGDYNLLQLVWINLLNNAVKFTGLKEKARIEIGFKAEINEYVFFVRDNGAGFDMKYADKLFGVFQRLHSSEEFEGTGIGLANVHRIILKHGGRTWAEAELDKGAAFYFSLPNLEVGRQTLTSKE